MLPAYRLADIAYSPQHLNAPRRDCKLTQKLVLFLRKDYPESLEYLVR